MSNDRDRSDTRSIPFGGEWTVPDEAGVKRRTIVQGAAWTVPVVAAAVASPLAAASTTPTYTLAFDQDEYPVGSDCTLKGVTLTLRDNAGAPAAGQTVTTTLPAGWTFAGGGRTYSTTTDANGLVTLPTITATKGAGTFTLNSSAPAVNASDTATADIDSQPNLWEYNSENGKRYKLTRLPAGTATALGGGYFQLENGDIYDYRSSTPVVRGAGKAVGYSGQNGNYYVDYISSTGVASTRNLNTGTTRTYPWVPSSANPVGGGFFLGTGGALWGYNQQTRIASGVTSASGYISADDTNYWVDFVNASGTQTYNANTGLTTVYNSSLTAATAVGSGYFLQSNGVLRYRNEVKATNVKSAVGYPSATTANAVYFADYVTNDGRAFFASSATSSTSLPNVPLNSSPRGGGYFLAGDQLWSYQGGGRLIASNVDNAVGYPGAAGTNRRYWSDYVIKPSSCI